MEGGSAASDASVLLSERAGDSGSSQAAVTVGVLMQVLLVVVFSVVEGPGLRDLCGDLAQAAGAQGLRGTRREAGARR